jgi:hypothetical protein
MDKSTCSFDPCVNPVRYGDLGLCDGHYQQRRKGKELRPLRLNTRNMTHEQRFWAKVQKSAGCWEWMASKAQNGRGYGSININGKMTPAHRFSWELANGVIPDGMEVDHICFNMGCVNPAHLRLVTRAENCQYRQGASSNNRSSGVRGVYWNARADKWIAKVKHMGKYTHVGTFETVEEADIAVRAKRAEMFKHSDPVTT